VRNRLVALGSPCGPENEIDRAILEFRRHADAQDRVPIFYEVLEPDLSHFHDAGFDLFKLGELAIVKLDEFSLAGKRWEDLRQAVNRSTKEQLTFEMVAPPHDSSLIAEVREVSDAWLAEKGSVEKGFSLGRFDGDPGGYAQPARRARNSATDSGLTSAERSPAEPPSQTARTTRRITFMLRVFGRSDTSTIRRGR